MSGDILLYILGTIPIASSSNGRTSPFGGENWGSIPWLADTCKQYISVPYVIKRMAELLIPVSTEDHVRGNPDAMLSLVEYGDFESRRCKTAAGVIRALLSGREDHIVYAFRHFPLPEKHPYAERAAEAAEAASAQGETYFWKMHDMLFEHQDALDDDSLIAYADLSGLDVERFTSDIESRVYALRVRRDYMRGLQNGIRAVPTFFISNHLYAGVYSLSELLRAIRRGKKRVIEGFV